MTTKKSDWGLREVSKLQRGIDRMFDDFLSPIFETGIDRFMPACDVEETDTHFVATFDLPGVDKSDVKIELRDNQLVIYGELKDDRKDERSNKLTTERYRGAFLRSLALPFHADADQAEASYDKGVLRVLIPKTEAAKPKLIQIKEEKKAA